MISGSGAGTVVSLDATDPFSWTNNYNGFMSSAMVPVPGLTSSILFNFLGTTGNSYNFSYTLSNTVNAVDYQAARVTIFGFNTDPNIASTSTGAPDLFNTIAAGNQPNGLAGIEVCYKDSGPSGNCTGANGGVAIGGSTSGTFNLAFASLPAAVSLSDFSVRYQGIDSTKYGFRGDSASGVPTTMMTPVPEPATWMMMLAGLGIIGSSMRRKRRIPSFA